MARIPAGGRIRPLGRERVAGEDEAAFVIEREFQLKFVRDREGWMHWVHDARKRHGLTILNDMVTSNHIHLPAVAQRNP